MQHFSKYLKHENWAKKYFTDAGFVLPSLEGTFKQDNSISVVEKISNYISVSFLGNFIFNIDSLGNFINGKRIYTSNPQKRSGLGDVLKVDYTKVI